MSKAAAPGRGEVSHLPGCRLITFREIAAEAGESPPEDDDWFDRGGIQSCAEGCPHRDALRAHAREVAREKGWLRADGTFVW